MTKTKVLIISASLLALSFIVDYLYKSHLFISRKLINLLLPTLFIFSLPLVIFSLITYKMREEVFRAWLHFAYWWIPVSLIFIYLAGGWTGGGFGIPNVLDQESVSIIFAGLFVIISLFIILISWFRNRA
ncbi:hypothetical protein HY415_02775 [Candidatus Kaiserbacteria bacterium]|nr:hypothetical protein [Candidatus Kaiserbacteria bacterium]